VNDLVLVVAGRLTDPSLVSHTAECEACRLAIEQIHRDAKFLSDLLDVRADSASGASSGHGPGRHPASALATMFVPGYQFVRELRRGGQGVVYEAVQDDTKRTVALKMLLSGPLASARERFRFEREMEIAASLRHPNIVTVFESVESSDGRRGYAMELIRGSPIDDWAGIADPQKPTATTLRQRLLVLAKVCRAVQYAHARGVIHRDLKPGNILIGEHDEPRVLDFGLAKRSFSSVAPDAATEMAVTRQGVFEGTPAYASPEQVDGRSSDDVDARSDLYSLAVIAYRLVTGGFPYAVGGSPREVFNAICTAEPLAPQMVARQLQHEPVPSDLETILLKALSKDRERRYQTAEALAADLGHFLAGEAVDAKRDSTLYVIRKSVWKYRRPIGAAVVVALALVAAAGIAASGVMRARAARLREELEATRARDQANQTAALSYLLRELIPGKNPALAARVDRASLAINSGALSWSPELQAEVQLSLGTILAELDDPVTADLVLRRARTSLQSERPVRKSGVARCALERASVLYSRKVYDEAETLAVQAAGLFVELEGEQGEGVAAARDLQARILLALNRPEEAEVTSRLALSIREGTTDALPLSHADSLQTRASIFLALRRPAEAAPCALKALKIRLASGRDDHPSTVDALRVVADVLDAGGGETPRESESDPLPSAALRELADSLVQIRAGKDDDAITIHTRMLSLRSRLVGPDHPSNVQSLARIAAAHEARKEDALAAATYEKAAGLHFGPPPTRDFNSADWLQQASMGWAYAMNYERSFVVGEQALRLKRAAPLEVRDLMMESWSACILAEHALLCGRFADGERVALESIEGLRTTRGEASYTYARARSTLACSLARQGKLEQAQKISDEAVAIASLDPAATSNSLLYLHRNVGIVYTLSGDRDADARECLAKAWNAGLRDYAAEDERRQEAVQCLVELSRRAQNTEEVVRWELELLPH
jgi:serine/threonine protein kinase